MRNFVKGMVMNLCVLRITFFIFGTVKLIYIYIFIYLSSYINRIVFTIIIFPFGRKISTQEKYTALEI